MPVQINTDQVRSAAGEIRSARGQMESIANDASQLVSSLSGTWEGPAANQFRTTFGQVQQKLSAANTILDDYVSFLEATASEYEENEGQRESDNASFEGGQ